MAHIIGCHRIQRFTMATQFRQPQCVSASPPFTPTMVQYSVPAEAGASWRGVLRAAALAAALDCAPRASQRGASERVQGAPPPSARPRLQRERLAACPQSVWRDELRRPRHPLGLALSLFRNYQLRVRRRQRHPIVIDDVTLHLPNVVWRLLGPCSFVASVSWRDSGAALPPGRRRAGDGRAAYP